MNAANTLAADSIVYAGEFIFKNGQLGKYLFEGGYATFAGGQPTFHYYTRDHLGNNRTVVSHGGTVEQVNHYYPFGAVYSDAGTNDALQRYKYNGKELDRMHGMNLYDYGARSYDPLLCRFTQTDPMAEKYYDVNLYLYCLNNPVNAIDPDGNSVWSKAMKLFYRTGKAVAKNGPKALKTADTYIGVFSDVTDAFNTLTDDNATATDKVMAGISLASELAPVSVGDMKEAGKVVSTFVHGNSKASTKAQHAYDIINTKTGKRVKTGISGGRIRKDGKSARAESQVKDWNKEAGENKYESEIKYQEPAGEGARERILEYERIRADELRKNGELDPIKHQKP